MCVAEVFGVLIVVQRGARKLLSKALCTRHLVCELRQLLPNVALEMFPCSQIAHQLVMHREYSSPLLAVRPCNCKTT